ncbi:MAG: hypothetical protein Q9163_003244 [Psora crenata]
MLPNVIFDAQGYQLSQQVNMKSAGHLLLLSTALHLSATWAQLVWPKLLSPCCGRPAAQLQEPIMNIPIHLPGGSHSKEDNSPADAHDLQLSDVIGKDRVINIFAGFTRDVDSISKRLDDPDNKTTVLAPLNSELQKLPRKPWEAPEDYDAMGAEAYKGKSGEERAARNLKRFVEAHAIPVSPWKEGEKVRSLGKDELWWEEKDGKKVVGGLSPWKTFTSINGT